MRSKIILHQGSLKIEFFHQARLLYNTNVRVPSKFWNKKKQFIIHHDGIDVDTLNEIIHSKRKWIDSLILEDYNSYGRINVQRIKAIVKKGTSKETKSVQSLLVCDLYQQFFDTHESGWSRTLKKRYKNIGEMVAKENIVIDEMDKMYISRLVSRISAGELGEGINANTLKVRVKQFKSFYKWCIEKGFAKPNEHLINAYKDIKDFEPDFITLTEERIQELFDYNSRFITYNKVRDTALILIFTGMRYSDFETLDQSDIVGGYIDKISIKTKIRFKVPLHTSVESLVRNFKRPLPQQKFNYYFKKVGEDLGWNEDIRMRIDFDKWETAPFYLWLSSHVGRHTAATRWLLQSVPPHIIKIWGGWKKESMINHYGAKIQLTTDDYMSRIPGEIKVIKIGGMTTNNTNI